MLDMLALSARISREQNFLPRNENFVEVPS